MELNILESSQLKSSLAPRCSCQPWDCKRHLEKKLGSCWFKCDDKKESMEWSSARSKYCLCFALYHCTQCAFSSCLDLFVLVWHDCFVSTWNSRTSGVFMNTAYMYPLNDSRELKQVRFWDADGNRKRTFHVTGQWCLPDFYTNNL